MIARPALRLILLPLLPLLASCAAGNIEHTASASLSGIWSVDVDQRRPSDPSGYSHPAVTAASKRIVIGGRDGRIHIYNLEGSEQAAVAIDAPSDSGALALPNGLAVIGDVGGMLYAVDPVAGHIVWKRQLGAPFVSDPVILGDGFIVQTMDDHIYHFSADGNKRWSYAGMGSGLSLYMTAPPLVQGSRVYAMFANGDAVALKGDSGDLIWRKQLLLNNDAAVLTELRAPVAKPLYLRRVAIGVEHAEDALLVSFYQGRIMVLAADDGRQLFAVNSSIKSAPLVANNTLYIAGADGDLKAIDLSDGFTLWKKKLSEGELIGPVLYNGALWLADDRCNVMRIGMDGNHLAAADVNGRIERLPVATPSGVLVRTGQGRLTLLR